MSQGFPQKFKFAFLTDMHVHSDSTLQIVQRWVEKIDKTDFFLTGGDNVDIDNLSPATLDAGRARYGKLKEIFEKKGKPYYAAIGNHDRLPSKLRDGKNDFEIFEAVFGKTYYAFEHKKWKFVVLNSVETPNGKYEISGKQLAWLEEELQKTPADQPVVVVSHVPFLSVYYPVLEGRYTDADTFVNQKKVFDLFSGHNLKLVLQGHMHLYEEIKVKEVQFITAGAVSGNWWNGAYHGTKPGYLEVELDNHSIKWIYKDVK
ncbi:MAG: metallophosphoesterase [Leadbetterella sp.]|nr:metallophosphoesterase [Leadbetterella sp.]